VAQHLGTNLKEDQVGTWSKARHWVGNGNLVKFVRAIPYGMSIPMAKITNWQKYKEEKLLH
jgi:hypothetical protein